MILVIIKGGQPTYIYIAGYILVHVCVYLAHCYL